MAVSTITLQKALNQATSGLGQVTDPLKRAREAAEVLGALQRAVVDVATIRRNAVAEALERPDMSLAKVAATLNVAKSTIAKLAPRYLREAIANNLRAPVAKGLNLPQR